MNTEQANCVNANGDDACACACACACTCINTRASVNAAAVATRAPKTKSRNPKKANAGEIKPTSRIEMFLRPCRSGQPRPNSCPLSRRALSTSRPSTRSRVNPDRNVDADADKVESCTSRPLKPPVSSKTTSGAPCLSDSFPTWSKLVF